MGAREQQEAVARLGSCEWSLFLAAKDPAAFSKVCGEGYRKDRGAGGGNMRAPRLFLSAKSMQKGPQHAGC